MSKKFLTPIVYPVLSYTPADETGATYYDTRFKAIMFYDGTTWQTLSVATEIFYPNDVNGGFANSTYIDGESLIGTNANGIAKIVLDGGYIFS
jgi:hypothetical protein